MSVIRERIELCREGKYPLCIGRMESGWVVMNEEQPLRGYCVLLADPPVESLNALSTSARAVYCLDMIRVGDALLKVAGAYRINYETWGNLDPNLHTHIVPRFREEEEAKRVLPLRQAYDLKNAPKIDDKSALEFIRAMRKELKI